MIDFEEVKKYLPQYLCGDSQDNLFKEIKSFPSNIDDRLYSQVLRKDAVIYQGDGLDGMLVINLPSSDIRPLRSIVISNTCDIHQENERFFPFRIIYAPIFNLGKYKQKILEEYRDDKDQERKTEDHINSIRKQLNTQIFYLPKGAGLENDSIVFLDRLNNCPSDIFPAEEIKKRKLFTLSDYGFYLFLIKLSIHFTRIREDVERTILKQ